MAKSPIPEPILTPYPRKHRPDLKPLVPATSQQLAGNETPAAPQNPQEKAAKTGNEPATEPIKKKQQVREAPVLEIIENGTKIPLPFKAVPAMEAMMNANNTVLMVMLRQLRDMKGQMPDTSSGALATINKVQHGLRHGEDISGLSKEISVHVTGLAERRELLNALGEALNQEREVEFLNSRQKMEDFLHSCQRRSDLNVIEAIALQAYSDNQLEKIYNQKKKGGGGTMDISVVRQPEDLVRAVNYPTQLQRKELESKFEQASPMEREILRKLGFKIKQGIQAARITKKTTETTETVEVVSSDGSGPS